MFLHKPQGSIPVWVLEGKAKDSLFQLSQCLSWSRTIKHTGKCPLFVYLRCMCPRFAWMTWLSIFELLECQLGGSSPCVYQTWYQKGKDHCHLEWNCTLGKNCDLSVPTKISQHPHDTHIYMCVCMHWSCQCSPVHVNGKSSSKGHTCLYVKYTTYQR